MPIEKESWYVYAQDKGVPKDKAQEYWDTAKESIKDKKQDDFTDDDWQKVMGTFKKIIDNYLKSKNESTFITTSKKYILEGVKIKQNAKLLMTLHEAFASGSAGKVVQKLAGVLSRKIGYNINVSEIPIFYENSYGQFAGYYGAISNGVFIKINFLLSSSDSIESFDIYLNGLSDTPDYTIDTNGLNIVQIVNLISENLIEDGEVNENVLSEKTQVIQEKGPYTDVDGVIGVIEKFVAEDKSVLKDLQNKPVPEIFNGVWGDWVSGKPNYESIKFYLFSKALKQYLLSKGLTNKTFRQRKKGSKEREIQDPVLSAQFDDIVDSLSWQEKFEFLKGAVEQLAKGTINAIYVYGQPGSGKSYEVLSKLDELGVEYKLYKGNVIKTTDDLFRILFNNKDDSILVFDDADAVLKKTDPNIWKTILENSKNREITYVDISRKDNKAMKDIPPKFTFTSGVIFISNEPKLNSAIASRAFTLDIDLSNDQVIDKIEKTLENFRPEVPMNLKREALEYAKEISPGVEAIDYRVIDKILISMQISPGNWKKTVLWMIKSM